MITKDVLLLIGIGHTTGRKGTEIQQTFYLDRDIAMMLEINPREQKLTQRMYQVNIRDFAGYWDQAKTFCCKLSFMNSSSVILYG